MKAGVLFSGGKDSALSAILLCAHYEVELNTFAFSPDRDLGAVEAAAKAIGLPYYRRTFPPGTLGEAVRMIRKSGYPNDAINHVHRIALTTLAREYTVIADGTRLEDRVPKLTLGEVQHLQHTTGCSYIRPLLGYGRREVNHLVSRYLAVRYGETGTIPNGDYEGEIRMAISSSGSNLSEFFPPSHEQSIVTGCHAIDSRQWPLPSTGCYL